MKEAVFETVQDMILNGNSLPEGTYVRTAGYHGIGDGGDAHYLIVEHHLNKTDDPTIVILEKGTRYAKLLHNGKVNIKQFGAIANENVDNSEAIIDAIRAEGVCEIVFPCGEYRIANTIYLNNELNGIVTSTFNHKRLVGMPGSTIRWKDDAILNDTNAHMLYLRFCEDVAIKSLVFDGSRYKLQLPKTAVPVYEAGHPCYFFGGLGIKIGASCDITVSDCTIRDTWSTGIGCNDGCHSILIDKCDVIRTGGKSSGIAITNGSNITVKQCSGYVCYGAFVNIEPNLKKTSSGPVGEEVKNCFVLENSYYNEDDRLSKSLKLSPGDFHKSITDLMSYYYWDCDLKDNIYTFQGSALALKTAGVDGTTVENVKFIGNTIYQSGTSLLLHAVGFGIIFENNIFHISEPKSEHEFVEWEGRTGHTFSLINNKFLGAVSPFGMDAKTFMKLKGGEIIRIQNNEFIDIYGTAFVKDYCQACYFTDNFWQYAETSSITPESQYGFVVSGKNNLPTLFFANNHIDVKQSALGLVLNSNRATYVNNVTFNGKQASGQTYSSIAGVDIVVIDGLYANESDFSGGNSTDLTRFIYNNKISGTYTSNHVDISAMIVKGVKTVFNKNLA